MDGEPPQHTGPRRVEPRFGRRHAWLGAELLLGVVLGILLALLALGFVLNAAGAYHSSSGRVGQAVGAVVCLALLVPCVRWTISVEHRLRRHHPVAQRFEDSHQSAPVPRNRVLGRRGRRYGPVGLTVGTLLFAGAAAGFAIGAVVTHAQASRSSYVQHHGMLDAATVVSVVNTQHCSRSGCHYTAAIAAALESPVADAVRTTVHYPGFSSLEAGERVQVLVDPKQSSYAELPGSRFTTEVDWIILTLLAVVEAFLAYLFGRALVHVMAHRREHLAGSGLAPA
jgi:hypothetical protein